MTIPAVVAPVAVAPTIVDPAVVAPVVAAPIAPVHFEEPTAVIPPVVAPVVAPAVSDVVEYTPTGDPGLDVALAFVGRLGIAVDHPAMQATANGDYTLLEAHLAALGDKAQGWQQHVALAKQANERANAADQANNAAIATAVHEVAGGEQNWNAVKAWASLNADPAEKAQINAMFDAGPFQARAAAKMLVDLHAKAGGTTVEPASATANASAAAASSGTGPLSAKDYSKAVSDLAKKVGSHNLDTSPEYAALNQRRMASRG